METERGMVLVGHPESVTSSTMLYVVDKTEWIHEFKSAIPMMVDTSINITENFYKFQY